MSGCQLYLISPLEVGGDFPARLEHALGAGPVAAFQFRVKGVDQHEAARLAEPLQAICRRHDVAFIVNDSVSLAKRNLEQRGLPANCFVSDAEALPFADSSFDLVYSHGVLHHTPNLPAAVAEVHRVLRPGGRAIVMMYHRASLNYYGGILFLRRLGALLLSTDFGVRLEHRLSGDSVQHLREHAGQRGVGARRLGGIGVVVHDVDVQIAVARVAEHDDGQAGLKRQCLHGRHQVGNARHRHYHVLVDLPRREAAQRRRQRLARGPEPLACGLVEVTGRISLVAGSRLAAIYGASHAVEGYHCRYGLGPAYAKRLAAGPLRASAYDAAGEVRAVELDSHPFFMGTLFQPERSALASQTHPLITAFVEAASVATTARKE